MLPIRLLPLQLLVQLLSPAVAFIATVCEAITVAKLQLASATFRRRLWPADIVFHPNRDLIGAQAPMRAAVAGRTRETMPPWWESGSDSAGRRSRGKRYAMGGAGLEPAASCL